MAIVLASVVGYLVGGALTLWIGTTIRTDPLYADEHFWIILALFWFWPVTLPFVAPWWLAERFGVTNKPKED